MASRLPLEGRTEEVLQGEVNEKRRNFEIRKGRTKKNMVIMGVICSSAGIYIR